MPGRELLDSLVEVDVPSAQIAKREESLRPGLADVVVMEAAGTEQTVLTADLDLYREAARQGHDVVKFHHCPYPVSAGDARTHEWASLR